MSSLVKTALPDKEAILSAGPAEITAAIPLGVLLSEQPQLRTFQDLISFFYKMSDRSFPGATRLATRYGVEMDLLVRDRSAAVERLLVDAEAAVAGAVTGADRPTPPGDADLHSAKSRSIKTLVNLALGEVRTREVGGNNMGLEENAQA